MNAASLSSATSSAAAASKSSGGTKKKKSKYSFSSLMDEKDPSRLALSTRAAHIAGLRRLSERANSAPASPAASRKISFSFANYGRGVIQRLRACNVRIDPGLSEEEIERIQATFRFTFPPDLRGVLQQGLPLGPGFPDWRSQLASQKLRLWISLPKSLLCSDAELGHFWWRGWGAPPADPVRAARVARAALRRAPALIPVYGSCYLPADPNRAGNPVLFLGQSCEGFYCARDVADFFGKACFKSFVEGCCDDGELYVPEPIEARSSSSSSSSGTGLECTRRMIARCGSSVGEDHSHHHHQHQQHEELERRSSSVSARSVLTAGRASSSYGSRSSDGSSDDAAVPNPITISSSSSSSGRRIRRIEFWSDLIEKGQAMNCAAGWSTIDFCEDEDDGFVQMQPAVDWAESEVEAESESESDATWEAVKAAVVEMTEKLRSAGWNDKDVGEIVDSLSHQTSKRGMNMNTNSSSNSNEFIDRQGVLEALATQLDFLSTCMREAGWSLNDITESLCFDLSGFSEPSKRVMRKLSPEVASRIGVLAAFVAQG